MARPAGTLCTNPATGTARARAWQRIRTFHRRDENFALDDLATGGERSNLRKYLSALVDAGILKVVETKNGKAARYRMIRDPGAVSPVLRADGEGITDPNALKVRAPRKTSPGGTGRERIWRALRSYGQRRQWFTAREVALVVGEIGERYRMPEIRRYLAALAASGHLRQGVGRGRHSYMMVDDTGPLHPILRKDGGIYDRNTGREHAHGGTA